MEHQTEEQRQTESRSGTRTYAENPRQPGQENQLVRRLESNGREIILVGTAHVSQRSAEEVAERIAAEKPDGVCVELDDDRLRSMRNEKAWRELDIVKILREGKGFLLLSNLALSSFQKRMGNDVGAKPGVEMQAAVDAAEAAGIPCVMVDRPIQVTLRRAWAKNTFSGKVKLLSALLSSAFSREKMSEEEIESLKNQSVMDGMMEELSEYLPRVKEVLIDERDRYLASKIWDAPGKKTLAVLGAGHLNGTSRWLEQLASGEASGDVSDISTVPPKKGSAKFAGAIIPLLIAALLIAGFFTGGAKTSLEMLVRWLLWNGSLAAAGSLIALAHPLTILVSFVGAPIATVNPFIGVGLFAGICEATVRKPRVKDMESLAADALKFSGFYKNRIAHVLLVFFLSSLGGAIGNFIAVPSLISSLL